jgi:hypothetical protein
MLQPHFRFRAFSAIDEKGHCARISPNWTSTRLSDSANFPMAREKPKSEIASLRASEATLRELLPEDWAIRREPVLWTSAFDACFIVRPADGDPATLLVEAKTRVGPRDVGRLLERWDDAGRSASGGVLLVAPYLSSRTRELLEARRINYLDTTGNVRIALRRPALFIRTQGAESNPWPPESKLRSVKGPAASRVVRAVLDFKPPYGISELAARCGSPLATVHRVIELLDGEGLLERAPRGPITDVDWRGVLERWTSEYNLFDSNRVSTFLEPRGLDRLQDRLREFDLQYAVTGSLAAARFAPVAAPRLAMVGGDGDTETAAETLGVVAAESGGNVFLIEPFDPVAFERGPEQDEIRYAAASQVAADLARSPGRGSSESAALVRWMAANEDAWRT